MTVDHDRARRIADGWASSDVDYPPAGELARAYLDVLKRRAEEEPHHRALREMRASLDLYATPGGPPVKASSLVRGHDQDEAR